MKEDKSGFTRYLKQYLSSAINLFPQFYTRVSQLFETVGEPDRVVEQLGYSSTTVYPARRSKPHSHSGFGLLAATS